MVNVVISGYTEKKSPLTGFMAALTVACQVEEYGNLLNKAVHPLTKEQGSIE